MKAMNDDRHKKLAADVDRLLALTNELKSDVDKANKDELSVDGHPQGCGDREAGARRAEPDEELNRTAMRLNRAVVEISGQKGLQPL